MKYFFTIIFLFISVSLLAPYAGSDRSYKMIEEKPDPFMQLWEALKMVESSNNPFAINHAEQAYGVSQIRQVRLDDYYKRTGKRYTLEECLNEEVSLEIFRFYFERYESWELAVRRWNGSGSRTYVYLDRVKNELSKVEAG